MERNIPKHVALILDGNGRWAKQRGKIRIEGHKVGFNNIETIAIYAQSIGIKYLSLYCFSTENWNRPKMEVTFLMNVPVELSKKVDIYMKHNIKVVLSGRREKMPKKTLEAFETIIDKTKSNTGLVMNVCFDYGALYDIKCAIEKMVEENVKEIDEKTIFNYLSTRELPPVDLLIRPGGEKRLSNYLLLESAYAELYFSDIYWPDFKNEDLDDAVTWFSQRNRRYGSIKENE